MKIRFTKKRLHNHLTFGIIWFVLGTIALVYAEGNVLFYGYIIIGILHFGTFLFENNQQYLTIKHGILTKNHLIAKRINLDEIKQIKKYSGAYTLITGSTQLKINTKLIEEKSLAKLNKLLEELNLEHQ